jgi:hypothetical protein
MVLFCFPDVIADSKLTELDLNRYALVHEFTPRKYYRYKDEHGRTVLNDRVPNRLKHNGYTILSLEGDILYVIDPHVIGEEPTRRQPTDEEIQARVNIQIPWHMLQVSKDLTTPQTK